MKKKRILATLGLATILLAPVSLTAKEETVTLEVTGMS